MVEQIEESGNWASIHRPQTLEEYCGHGNIKAKVEGMFSDKKKPGCIGITGHTGFGKTTLARIIANRFTKFPSDIIERDMGSKGSKDDIRELIGLSKYAPRGNFRVFIIDEFHLVQAQASSLLLKLMEEPPKRTIFIWCTNESQKVLPTLIGRSFMIRLGEMAPSDIVPFMTKVCIREGFKFSDKALRKKVLLRVADMCNGQPRASINLLEELYKTVRGNGNVKDALMVAVKQLEEVSPDLAATKFMLMVYLNKPEAALKALWDYKGTDWKVYLNALTFLNTWIFKNRCDVFEGPWGTRKIFSEKLKEKGGISKVPVNKTIAVQNYLVDILKEWGTFGVTEQMLVPARLAALVVRMCKD